jgi:hypothetical protein
MAFNLNSKYAQPGNPLNAGTNKPAGNNGPSVNLGDYSGSKTYKARGGAGTFDANKYQIENMSYPTDLMGSLGEYGNNYVIFYINVAEDSKLIKDKQVEVVEDSTPRDYGDLAAISQQANLGTVGAVGAAALPAITTLAVSGNLKSKATAATLGTAVAGGLALQNLGATFSGQKKRLKTAIALHTPNTLSTKYTMNYEEDNLDVFGGLVAGTSALKKAAEKKGMSNIMKDLANQGAAAVAAAGLNIPGTAGLSRLTGLAANPRKEQIFKAVEFRVFQFDYQFYPRDAQEAQNVLDIIYQFKLHMHPEFKDANNFLYIYPSEFDIFYYNGTQENLNINRHTSCVLTDLNVDYSPNGQFTSFADGMPTQINISLVFKELATLTKEKIQDGL